jgi:UDPglucose 6-dehydrogenase
MREAPSLVIIRELVRRGARVTAYDPVATNEAIRILGDDKCVRFGDSAMQVLEGADALVVVTEWKEFRSPDFHRMREAIRGPVIFDGRNILDPASSREAGFEYFGIGRS